MADFLEEHHGFVVELNLIKLLLDSELDVEFFSKSSASRSVEFEGGDVVVFTSVGSDISTLLDLQWDVEAVDLEWSDLEVNWNDYMLENLSSSAGEYASEDASWLVGLLGIVHEVNSCNQGFSWSASEDTWNRDNLGSSESPSIWLWAFSGSVSSLALAFEWASASHHSFEGTHWTASATSASPATLATSASPFTSGKLLHHILDKFGSSTTTSSSHSAWALVSEEGWVFLDITFNVSLSWSVLINGGEDSSWCHSWVVDLNEWMRMVLCFLAFRAEVEVFGNGAFVSWTNDWCLTTTVTFHVWMYNRLWVDGGLSGRHRIDLLFDRLSVSNVLDVLVSISIEHALKDLLALLVKLLSDHLFEGLLWHLLSIFGLLVLLSVFTMVLSLLSFSMSKFTIIRRGVIITHVVIFCVILLASVFTANDFVQGLLDVGAGNLFHLHIFLLGLVLLGGGLLWLDHFWFGWDGLDLLSGLGRWS